MCAWSIGLDDALKRAAVRQNRHGTDRPELRDAIAHFLIERDGADVHVYLAEGAQYQMYSTASAALLHYAHLSLEELRLFYVKNAGPIG